MAATEVVDLKSPTPDLYTSDRQVGVDIAKFKALFSQHFSYLEKLDLASVEALFLNIPANLLPRDIAHRFRAFSKDEGLQLLHTFLEMAHESHFETQHDPNWSPQNHLSAGRRAAQLIEELGDGLGTFPPIDKKLLSDLLQPKYLGASNPYLLERTPIEMAAIATEQAKYLKTLSADQFTIYLARDAAPLMQLHTYLSLISNSSKSSGLIYHGGLKVGYTATTSLNALTEEIMAKLTLQFLEPDDQKDPFNKHWCDDGMAKHQAELDRQSKKGWKLRANFENWSDEAIFQEFQGRFINEVSKVLDSSSTKENGSLFSQAQSLFSQMINSGVFESSSNSLVFCDTTGTGKTVLLAKAVYDYFLKKFELEGPPSKVLVLKRFSNYTDHGQSRIPGFPCIFDESGVRRTRIGDTAVGILATPYNKKLLTAENDIQPFFAKKVGGEGIAELSANSLPGQIMCLVRSIINWNTAISQF